MRLRVAAVAALVVTVVGGLAPISALPPAPALLDPYAPTPGGRCGPGSNPEATQGRAPLADYDSGRAYAGYTCNAAMKANFGTRIRTELGTSGGYRVHRYVDAAGHECAFYDSALLFPTGAVAGTDLPGVYVLDMSVPARPRKTANLLTPAMQSPHESLSLHAGRGLLAATMGSVFGLPGMVDIYDVSADCRHPVLRSSLPVGLIGHEGQFSPDGKTYWVSATATQTLAAIDVTDPALPSIVFVSRDWSIHGFGFSADGNLLYGADTANSDRQRTDPPPGAAATKGLTILDVSGVQGRLPHAQVRKVSHLTWPGASQPMSAIPVTIPVGTQRLPRHFVIEVDEFAGSPTNVGAARIIDVEDPAAPFVVSNLRLQVHHPDNQSGGQTSDPGAASFFAGYAAHTCSVPRRDDPGIVACSFIVSGLRIFDIRDPYQPREVAYFNRATRGLTGGPVHPFAMSAPAFAPERGEVWYVDASSGFYNVQITNGVWP